MNSSIKSFVFFAVICAVFYYVYFFYYYSVHSIVPPGDSTDYHIPIAKSILNGTFISGAHFKMPQWYYPGASEVINSLFIFFKIPLVFSNFFATGVLFFVLIKLARIFGLRRNFSLLFALTFITLNIILRWLNQVTIDTWVAVFFCLTLITLENSNTKKGFFIKLGFFSGMLIGSKYTAISLLIPLVFIYWRKIIRTISIKNFLLFFVPFLLLGLFWYIRNYILTTNPFYPLPILGLAGKEIFGGMRVWNVTLQYPIQMLNAFISEFKIWVLTIPAALFFLGKKSFIHSKNSEVKRIQKVFLLGIVLLAIYFFYPTSQQEWIMVSSLRYSYPAFILLILGSFMTAQFFKKEIIIAFISITSMLGIFLLEYHPKLIFIQIPVSLLCIWITHVWMREDASVKIT